MSKLPPLTDIQTLPSSKDSALATALSILFEPSPILLSSLEPQLHQKFKSSSHLKSYIQLIDLSLEQIATWPAVAQSEFISGHPRIGESASLSKLSAKEQGAQGLKPTPPEVLASLAHLNAAYEIKYPGLRYITFVNGRSHAAIAKELEVALGLGHSPSPSDPALDTITPVESTSDEWSMELKRAIVDVGRIAKSRLGSLGVV